MDRGDIRPNTGKVFRWLGLVGICGLTVLGTASSVFTLLAFAVVAIQIVFGDEDFSWQMIFALNSFSTIFKLSPGSTSLFTYILLLLCVMLFLKRRTIPPSWLLLAIYLVAVPVLTVQLKAFNVLKWIKLLCGLLLAYYYFDDNAPRNDTEVFWAFIFGLLGASFTRLIDSHVFRIERFLEEIDTVGDAGKEFMDVVRYAGLSNDANYYTVNLIISLCLLIILLYERKTSLPLFLALAAMLLYFDVSTYSKSAMLMLILPISVFVYTVKKSGRRSLRVLLILGAAGAVAFLVITGGGAFGVVLSRLSAGEGDLSKLTTGRTTIWLWNLEFFAKHPGWFLIGKGINAALINGRGHHNTYIECIYHLGLIGSGLLPSLLGQTGPSKHPKHRNLLNYCILITVLIMYMFLSALLFYDFPFQIILVLIVLNMDFDHSSEPHIPSRR